MKSLPSPRAGGRQAATKAAAVHGSERHDLLRPGGPKRGNGYPTTWRPRASEMGIVSTYAGKPVEAVASGRDRGVITESALARSGLRIVVHAGHTGPEGGRDRFQTPLSADLTFAPGDLWRLASLRRPRRWNGLIDRLGPCSCLRDAEAARAVRRGDGLGGRAREKSGQGDLCRGGSACRQTSAGQQSS